MTARVLQIADLVVEALNARGGFALPPSAVRLYLPRWKLPELEQLRTSVIPRARRSELETRGSSERRYRIEVAIQKKLARDNDQAELDPLVTLCEEIEDFLLGNTLDGATCIEAVPITGDDELYDWTHMEDKKLFTWGLALTFTEGVS
jgi:hypothetical protein